VPHILSLPLRGVNRSGGVWNSTRSGRNPFSRGGHRCRGDSPFGRGAVLWIADVADCAVLWRDHGGVKMKRLFAWVVAVVLSCQLGLAAACADMVSPGPIIPKRPESRQQARRDPNHPPYAIAAWVVATTLTGSLVALRMIRKKDGNGPS
jgi:hypothetical protein